MKTIGQLLSESPRTDKIPQHFEYFSDPGHGWLKVPLDLVDRLGILHAISPYSYYRHGFLYLEEDCDMPLFLRAMRAGNHPVSIRDRVARQRYSRIRNYPRFPALTSFRLVRTECWNRLEK